MQQFEPITATIDERFLSKVDRVFDASPVTVFNELLQNARRAGAHYVVVNLKPLGEGGKDGTKVTFTDNGKGIEDPSILLRLAAEGWEKEIDDAEDPAGMGFFCLSNFAEVTVASRNWAVTMTPEVFRGVKKVTPFVTTPSVPRGIDATSITWNWMGKINNDLLSHLREAAEYCGISKIIANCGVEDVLIEPKPFMHDALTTWAMEDYDLGVIPRAKSYLYDNYMHLNFKGVRFEEKIDVNVGCHHDLRRLRSDVKVDVKRSVDLHLVLPARSALKHNAARDRLMLEAESVLLYHVAQRLNGEHNLSFSTYERAKELDIDIGEAKRELKSQADRADFGFSYSDDYMPKAVILPHHFASRMAMSAWQEATSAKNTGLYPVQPKDRYEGYKWYADMPKVKESFMVIDGVRVSADVFYEDNFLDNFRDEKKPLHSLPEEDRNKVLTDNNFKKVGSIMFEVILEDGTGFTHALRAAVSGECTMSCFDSVLDEGRTLFFTEEATSNMTEVQRVSDLMETVCFEASDDSEADNWETQLDYFRKESHAWVLSALCSGDVAARYLLDALMYDADWGTREKGMSWTIHCSTEVEGDRPIPRLAHFQSEGNEPSPRMVVAVGEAGASISTVIFSSKNPISPDRAFAYFEKELGYDPEEDEVIIDEDGKIIDLDRWEKLQEPAPAPKEEEEE